MIQRRKITLGIIIVAMFSLLLVMIFGDNGLVDLRRLEHTRQTLIERNARLAHENSMMYQSIDRLKGDPVCIENIARRELGMIRSDELIFKFKHAPDARK